MLRESAMLHKYSASVCVCVCFFIVYMGAIARGDFINIHSEVHPGWLHIDLFKYGALLFGKHH